MDVLNIIFVAILIILGYVVYSYINSYNEIVNELKKIRLKCINGKNNDSNKKTKMEENEEVTEIEEENEDNPFEIIKSESSLLKPDLLDKNKFLINTGEEDNNNEETEKTKKIRSESVDFSKLSHKKNNSYDENSYKNKDLDIDKQNISNKVKKILNVKNESEDTPILESFENFREQSQLEYWEPYTENIDKVSEGFISCPYRGYNKELYEPLIIDSNTIKMRGFPGDNEIVNYNQVDNENNIRGNNRNKWCLVDKINKKCIQQNEKQICRNKEIYDTKFQCQGYSKLNK